MYRGVQIVLYRLAGLLRVLDFGFEYGLTTASTQVLPSEQFLFMVAQLSVSLLKLYNPKTTFPNYMGRCKRGTSYIFF